MGRGPESEKEGRSGVARKKKLAWRSPALEGSRSSLLLRFSTAGQKWCRKEGERGPLALGGGGVGNVELGACGERERAL